MSESFSFSTKGHWADKLVTPARHDGRKMRNNKAKVAGPRGDMEREGVV